MVFVSSESAIFVPKEMVHYGFSKTSSATNGAALRADGGIVTNPF